MKKKILAITLLLALAAPISAFACACQGNQYRTGTGPVTMDEAQTITMKYLASIDDGSLRPGNIELDGSIYVVDVFDADGNSVAKLNINMFDGNIQTKF